MNLDKIFQSPMSCFGAMMQSVSQVGFGVITGNAPFEQMWSALPPTTDMRRLVATLAHGLRITPAFAERSKVESRRRSQPGGGFFYAA
jgi:hypothetical protein